MKLKKLFIFCGTYNAWLLFLNKRSIYGVLNNEDLTNVLYDIFQ